MDIFPPGSKNHVKGFTIVEDNHKEEDLKKKKVTKATLFLGLKLKTRKKKDLTVESKSPLPDSSQVSPK